MNQAKAKAEPAANEPGVARGTVLVVDDSRLQRRILSSQLKRFGLHVVEADSGPEALKILESAAVDIVLSDWMMPGMTGLELCQTARQSVRQQYLYFILLTSKGEKGEIAEGLNAGADDFLTKPVNGEELRARIAAGQRIQAMQAELSEKNARLQALYDHIDRDLIEARKLQHSLIRVPVQTRARGEVSLFLRSSGRVGGDLVGSYAIDDNRIGLFAIDVSGHGIASALMTARLAGYLSSTAPDQNVALRRSGGWYTPVPPAEAAGILNTKVFEDLETEHYFTLLLAEVHLSTGRVVMCQAGHPNPVIQRRDGSVEFVGRGGLPVGLIEGAEYTSVELHMDPGDRLLIYSDGVTECANPEHRLFDEDGLSAFMSDARGTGGSALFDMLVWALDEFADGREFSDDISAVLFEFGARP